MVDRTGWLALSLAAAIGLGCGGGGDQGGAGGASSGGSAPGGGGPGAGSGTGAGGSNASTSSGPGGSGSGGGPSAGCKRGIASNTPPGAAFAPSVGWWYDWSLNGNGQGAGIEFAPMVWGEASAGQPVPGGAAYLLGFNEPNFHAQSNLTPQQAAQLWPMVEASGVGLGLVGPAMNFCGPADQCNGTSPYDYLKGFFSACTGCRVDYVAVHWYNCDLASLQDYLEPGGGLEGFEQFGKPIWLTEFSCNGGASVAEQQAYMEQAIPYLEQNPHVYRYSWFSAGPIPNAKLVNDDGTPTALGQVYIDLPAPCRP